MMIGCGQDKTKGREPRKRKTEMNTIEKKIKEIAADGCGIPYTDSGNGCGGPGMISNGDIDQMMEDGEFGDYVRDDEPAVDVQHVLDLLGQWDPDTKWWTATKVVGEPGDQNPYKLHLILWDVA
jgi:hypothetical protein